MRIVKDNTGSITVFLALIFVALLIVSGIIVDAARIMIAEKRVQSSLESAVRSGMAGYHEDLTGEFGLYGRMIDKEEVKRYYLTNLTERHENIRFIKYDQVKLDIETYGSSSSLLNDEMFKDQILEYMKYKAPLIMSENVGEKLVEFFSNSDFRRKAGFAASAQEAISIRKELKGALAALNNSIGNTATTIFEKAAAETINELEYQKVSLQNEIIRRIKAYELALNRTNDQKAGLETGNLTDPETASLLQKIDSLIIRIEESINVLRIVERLETERGILKRNADLQNELETECRINEIANEIERLKAKLPLLEEIALANPILAQFANNSAEEKEAKGIRAWLEKQLPVKIIDPDFFITERDFFRANDNVAEINHADEQPQLSNDGDYIMSEDFTEKEGADITAFLTRLVDSMSNVSADGRNRLYITEYVLDKCTFLTSATKRQHYFKKGEIEYILCGDNSEMINLLSMFGYIWFFRYALNTLATFVQSSVAHPLARLAYSLAKGFLYAWQDVVKLYNGEGVAIIPNMADGIKIKYSDHLRIFLLLQNEKTQLERVRQLIQINIKSIQKQDADFELGDYQTSCRAVAEADINLWFIPVLHLDTLGLERFHDDKYRIAAETVFGY